MPGAASYQMYAWPRTRPAARRFWRLIRSAYGNGDAELTDYDLPESAWTDPELLFSQTCGLPYRYRLHDRVTLLATPDYGVPGCPPGYYRSCLIVRADDPGQDLAAFRGARLARNSVLSQSGWAALELHLDETGADFRFRDGILDTGSHAASARAVADGAARLAAVDAVTWRFLGRLDPDLTGRLRVLALTRPTPGLPFITGRDVDPAPLFDALRNALENLPPAARRTLGLRGVVRLDERLYLDQPLPFPLAAGHA